MLAAGGADDPLDNEEQLADQMDSLPFLARFQYEATAEYLAGLFDPLAVLYKVTSFLYCKNASLQHCICSFFRYAWSCLASCEMQACIGISNKGVVLACRKRVAERGVADQSWRC